MVEEDERLPLGFPIKKTVDQNIMTKLYRREVAIDNPAQLFHRQRALYQCAVPEFTESNVQTPSCFLRKFTPDGNQLLAFSRDQRSVELYDYLGGGSGQELYSSELDSWSVRSELFGRFFSLRFSIPVAQENEFLNRECSLFTCHGHYLIVGASSVVPDDHYQHTFDLFRNNESVSPSANCQLEDYSLYMVDMRLGCVTDSRPFKLDKIYLSHNQGVSLCNTTLAVLSVQHQTVHLFQASDGTFLPLQEIGRFCYPDDPLIFSEVHYTQSNVTAMSDGLHAYNPWLEKWYTSLKHRLLCRLLRQAEEACTPQCQAPMAHFYMNHDKFVSLKLWRMQLLDEGHLLLKFATEDVVTMRQSDPTSQPALFGIYNIVTTEFLHIFDNTSESLLQLYELNADHFRTAVSHPHCHQISSVANSGHARALHHKFKHTIMGAKYGGRMEATRRLLGQLPICCQSYSCSPYLDLSLFSYDDKWISALERPKPCEDSSVNKPHSPPPHTGSSPGMVASFHSSFTWVVVHLLLHRRKVLLSQEALLANLWHTSFILTSPSLSPFRGPTLTSWSTSISGTSMEWPMKTILLDHMHQSSHFVYLLSPFVCPLCLCKSCVHYVIIIKYVITFVPA